MDPTLFLIQANCPVFMWFEYRFRRNLKLCLILTMEHDDCPTLRVQRRLPTGLHRLTLTFKWELSTTGEPY